MPLYIEYRNVPKFSDRQNVPKFSDRQVWANSADPDQTATGQSDQGLHCLPFCLQGLHCLPFGCITL